MTGVGLVVRWGSLTGLVLVVGSFGVTWRRNTLVEEQWEGGWRNIKIRRRNTETRRYTDTRRNTETRRRNRIG